MLSVASVWSGLASLTKQVLTPPSLPALYFSDFQEWGKWESRRIRYDFYWAWWTNSAYDSAHLWSGQFRTLYGLYKYTRGTYNPMYRLGEFWANTIWGGHLDVSKIGGRVVQSAIPLLTDDDPLREAVGRLWKDSRWQTQKNMTARYGAVMGDFAIKVEDDPYAGKVRLVPVNPQTLRWVQQDYNGRVLAYELWEPRWDPTYRAADQNVSTPGAGQQTVLYVEKCYLEDGMTVFETYKNYEPFDWARAYRTGNAPLRPFAWNGSAATWREDYGGMVPLVVHPHIQMHVGYFWGASEYQAAWRKSAGLDDVSSKQHDHIRKATDPWWFIAGSAPPKTPPKLEGEAAGPFDTQPGRQEKSFIYGGLGSTAVPMVFPVDNQFVSIEIQNMVASVEKDYPELRYDSARASGDASAKALREVRKSAEAKVHDRRSGYDETLVEAQKVALAIGGRGGYPGYEDFSAGALEAGRLEHAIGERSVFLMDPLDRIEEEQALATCWQTLKLAGWPDAMIATRFDFTPDEVAAFEAAKLREQEQALEQQKKLMEAQAAAQPKPAPAAGGGA